MKTILNIVLCLTIPLLGFSQHATFTLLSTNDPAGKSVYDSLSVWVNGTFLKNKNKEYVVKAHKKGFDTIKIRRDYMSKVDTILTRLKDGESYTVNFNPCSLYEIGPAKRLLKTRLMRVIAINSNRKKLYFNSGVFFTDLDTLQKVDTTFYYVIHPSSYCLFSTNSTSICTSPPDYNGNKNTCNNLFIQFMDAEKYTLLYDCKSCRMSIKFDGYYNKKEKIHLVN